MARRSAPLTTRQRQSQRIIREKKVRKARQALLHKTLWVSSIAFALLLGGGGFWAVKTGLPAAFAHNVSDSFYAFTVRHGYSVQSLYLDGRSRTSMADIEKALDIKKGDPILRLSLDEVRARLERIESVRFATVERELPGALYVHIVEREPVALWQHSGKIALVDDNGAVMNDLDVSAYQNLPLIVGNGAPPHVAELLAMLAMEPALAKRFTAATRVGERRWNIRLDNGIEVRLPEENPHVAWKTLATLEEKQQLLTRDVKVIDLRLKDRLFIRLPADTTPGKPASAKET